MSDFKGGNVEITVPYAVLVGESVSGFSGWYIDEEGNPEKLKNSYDGKQKVFVVTHFSDYVIAYSKEDALAGGYHNCPKDATCPIHPYTDASTTAWYHDGVHYCIDHGIMDGFGNGIFKPNGAVTRKQVWLTLARISDETPANAAEAREWAMEIGVSDGTNPTKAVTR